MAVRLSASQTGCAYLLVLISVKRISSQFFLSIFLILPATIGPGVYSASNRNEYQKQKNNVSVEQSVAGFNRKLGNYRVVSLLVASRIVLSSVELVNLYHIRF
jgi:hypothetical protein